MIDRLPAYGILQMDPAPTDRLLPYCVLVHGGKYQVCDSAHRVVVDWEELEPIQFDTLAEAQDECDYMNSEAKS